MRKITLLLFLIFLLFITTQGRNLNIYVDDLNIVTPSDELSFSISNYLKDETQVETIKVSIYTIEDAFDMVSRHVSSTEINDIMKNDPVFSYRIDSKKGWKRESIPATFFPQTGSYMVVFKTSEMTLYSCVERTNTAGIAIDFGDHIQLEVWDSLSGKKSEFGDIFTGKQNVHIGSLNNPDARRINKEDIQDEFVILNAPSGRAIVSIDEGNYLESYNKEMVFLSERPIYRPGDIINVKGYLYDRKASTFSNSGTITITMTDPMGTQLLKQETTADQWGGFEFSYETSEDAVRGHYDVSIKTNERTFYRYIELSDYQKPTFTVDVSNIKSVYGIGEWPMFDLHANYYYGQPIDKGVVHTTLNLLPDYSSAYDTKTLDIRSSELTNGQATDTLRISAEKVENYSVEFNVVDKSGREVSEQAYFKYVPSDVVIKTAEWDSWYNLKDSSVKGDFYIEAILNNAETANRTMAFEVIRKKNSVYNNTARTDENGKFSFEFDPFLPGYYKLRIFDTQYPANVIEKSFFVYSSDYSYSTTEKLEIIRNQEVYHAGDLVELDLISVFRQLNAYVIVDFGSTLITRRIQIDDNAAQMSFVIPQDVSRETPRIQIFSYYGGEAITRTYDLPVSIDRFDMNCDITTPEKVKPGETINIGVALSEKDGSSTDGIVTLNVIDQALIDLYGDDEWKVVLGSLSHPPYNYYVDYFNQYYNFARLFAFNNLEYEDASTLAQTKRAASKTGIKVRSDFSDSALWIPGVVVDGDYLFEMKLPENLTTWRTRAIAIGESGKRAYASDKFIATLPVTVNAIFPKFLITGDTIQLGINVGNYSGEKLAFDIAFESASINETRFVEIEDQSNEIYWFEYLVPEADNNELTFKLSALAYKGEELIREFSDSMEKTIIVKPRKIEINTGEAGIVTRDTIHYSYQPTIDSSVTLTLSGDLQSELIDTLAFLIRYPYGCTEQTISSFLPSLAFMEMKKDIPLTDEERELFAEVPAITEVALKKLYSYQNYDGAWGWWKNGSTDQFMTAYVMYTYYQLLQLGYDINMSSYKKGALALRDLMENEEERQPFAEYVTAMIFPSYSMVLTDRTSLSYKLFLALLMSDKQQEEVAAKLLDEIVEEGSSFNGQFKVNFDNTTYFINDLQMNALLFDLMNRLNYNGVEMIWLFNYLYNNKTGAYWTSTKDSAFVVMALSKYLKNSDDSDYRVNLNMLKSLASEGAIPEINGTLKEGETNTYTFNVAASEILNLDISGESGIMWQIKTSEFREPEDVEETGTILKRELVVKKKLKIVDKENSVSYESAFVPIRNSLIPEIVFEEGISVELDFEPESITGFRLEPVDNNNRYYRKLLVNGKDTGITVKGDVNLVGMSATSITFDRNPFAYKEGTWSIVFRENDEILKVGDVVRSIIHLNLPLEWRWAALEENIPACFVQDEDYSYDYYAGKYFSASGYLSHYYTSHVEDRYDRTTAFFNHIDEGVSTYMNNYKIIAVGEFIVPPIKLFEMYNPANNVIAPGLKIKVSQ